MLWIDAHCHPQMIDVELRTKRLNSWKQHWLLASSTNIKDYHELYSLKQRYPKLVTSIGWHPWQLSEPISPQNCQPTIQKIADIATQTRCPIGEIGLDFHPKWRSTHQTQIYIFEQLSQIAIDLDLPVIVHCVRAHHEILRILKKQPTLQIYLHGFRGNRKLIEQYDPYNVLFGCSILHFSNLWNPLYKYIDPCTVLFESDDLLSFSTYKETIESYRPAFGILPQVASNFGRLLEQTNTNFTI